MAPVASSAPTSSTGASSRPSPGRAGGACRRRRRTPARGTRPNAMTTTPATLAHEGQPDADRPEMGVDHQQAAPAVELDPTRVLRGVGRGVLHLDRVGQELARGVRAKWPTTTTGMRDWNSCGGLPVLTTSTTLAPWHIAKSAPAGGRVDRAGHHVALEPEARRPQLGRCASGLVDRVEVVERAPEPLDEQEHERPGQQGEDDEQPAAGPAPAADRPAPSPPASLGASAASGRAGARWRCQSRAARAGISPAPSCSGAPPTANGALTGAGAARYSGVRGTAARPRRRTRRRRSSRARSPSGPGGAAAPAPTSSVPRSSFSLQRSVSEISSSWSPTASCSTSTR